MQCAWGATQPHLLGGSLLKKRTYLCPMRVRSPSTLNSKCGGDDVRNDEGFTCLREQFVRPLPDRWDLPAGHQPLIQNPTLTSEETTERNHRPILLSFVKSNSSQNTENQGVFQPITPYPILILASPALLSPWTQIISIKTPLIPINITQPPKILIRLVSQVVRGVP